MALKRSLTVDGKTYPEAYSRITSLRCDKADAYVYVCTYENEQARTDEAFPIYAEEHICPLATVATDLFPKSYEFLKSLPNFEGAVDC